MRFFRFGQDVMRPKKSCECWDFLFVAAGIILILTGHIGYFTMLIPESNVPSSWFHSEIPLPKPTNQPSSATPEQQLETFFMDGLSIGFKACFFRPNGIHGPPPNQHSLAILEMIFYRVMGPISPNFGSDRNGKFGLIPPSISTSKKVGAFFVVWPDQCFFRSSWKIDVEVVSVILSLFWSFLILDPSKRDMLWSEKKCCSEKKGVSLNKKRMWCC